MIRQAVSADAPAVQAVAFAAFGPKVPVIAHAPATQLPDYVAAITASQLHLGMTDATGVAGLIMFFRKMGR